MGLLLFSYFTPEQAFFRASNGFRRQKAASSSANRKQLLPASLVTITCCPTQAFTYTQREPERNPFYMNARRS